MFLLLEAPFNFRHLRHVYMHVCMECHVNRTLLLYVGLLLIVKHAEDCIVDPNFTKLFHSERVDSSP